MKYGTYSGHLGAPSGIDLNQTHVQQIGMLQYPALEIFHEMRLVVCAAKIPVASRQTYSTDNCPLVENWNGMSELLIQKVEQCTSFSDPSP